MIRKWFNIVFGVLYSVIFISSLYFNFFVIRETKGLFESISKKKIDSYILFIPTFEQGVLGTCYISKLNIPIIVINTVYWNSLGIEQREMLVLHELAHCEVKKDHNDKRVSFFENIYTKRTCPKSIMGTHIFSDFEVKTCYNKFRDYYLKELINGE